MANRNDYSNRPSSENPDYRAAVNNTEVNSHAVNGRPATQEEIAYRNGYVEARNEERVRPTVYETREDNSAATGVVIGVVIAAIAGLTIAAFALFSPSNQEPTIEMAPIPAKPTQPQTNTNTKTEKTTIIERVRDAAPQQTKIIVPNPVQPQTTQPQTAQPQTQPQTTQPQATQSETQSDTSSQSNSAESQSSGSDSGMEPDSQNSQTDSNSTAQ